MPHIVNLDALAQINNVNNLEQITLPELDNLDPVKENSSVFEQVIHAAVDPYTSSLAKASGLLQGINTDLNQTGMVAPDKVIAVQLATNKAVVDTTVTAKAVNMIIKGINELVHTQ